MRVSGSHLKVRAEFDSLWITIAHWGAISILKYTQSNTLPVNKFKYFKRHKRQHMWTVKKNKWNQKSKPKTKSHADANADASITCYKCARLLVNSREHSYGKWFDNPSTQVVLLFPSLWVRLKCDSSAFRAFIKFRIPEFRAAHPDRTTNTGTTSFGI